MTNKQIWEKGIAEGSWACDINPSTGEMEANGGIVHLIVYKDRYYEVITTWDEMKVYQPSADCKEYFPEDNIRRQYGR